MGVKLPDGAPLLVRITMIGLNSRTQVLIFVVLSLLAAVASVIWLNWVIAVLFAIAAYFYYYTMNWIDKNGGWDG